MWQDGALTQTLARFGDVDWIILPPIDALVEYHIQINASEIDLLDAE